MDQAIIKFFFQNTQNNHLTYNVLNNPNTLDSLETREQIYDEIMC